MLGPLDTENRGVNVLRNVCICLLVEVELRSGTREFSCFVVLHVLTSVGISVSSYEQQYHLAADI
jgi:hypothetical protein